VTIDTFIAEAGVTLTLGSGALPLEGQVGVAPARLRSLILRCFLPDQQKTLRA
jgi:hypothetical protein